MSLSQRIISIHNQINTLNVASYQNRYTDHKQGVINSQKAYDLNISLSDEDQIKEGLVDSLNNLTWFKMLHTDYDRAFVLAKEAYELAQAAQYQLGIARTLGHLGRIKMYWGDYSTALEHHWEQYEICDAIGHDEEKSTTLNYLGNLYSRLEKPEDAIKAYEDGAILDRQLGLSHGLSAKLISIGMIFSQSEQLDDSLMNAKEGLVIAREADNKYQVSWGCGCLAAVYRKRKEYDTALKYAAEKFEIAIEISDEQQQLDALIEFGKIYLAKEAYRLAISKFEEAYELAVRKNFTPHLMRCYEGLTAAYKGLGDFEQALQKFEKYHELRESVFTAETARKVDQIKQSFLIEQAEKEAEILRLKTVELEQMVAARTKELTHVNRELKLAMLREKDLNKLKSKIIKTVSHEFRTPLTAIRVSADVLHKIGRHGDIDKREAIFSRIHASIDALNNLIEDILSVDTIDARQNPQPMVAMNYSELVYSLKQNLMQRFDEHAPFLLFKPEAWDGNMSIDLNQVSKILSYLIDNGFKYSDYKTPVTVDISVDPEENELKVAVLDEGIGINEPEAELIWEPFYRSESASPYRGLGLGLFMARQLTRQIDGNLVFEPNPVGLGTKFVLQVALS